MLQLVRQALPEDRSDKAIVNVNVIRYGSSAYDSCRRGKVNAHPINFGAGCTLRGRSGVLEFGNLRAYAYWSLREALDPEKGDGLMLPQDPELLQELSAARWKMTASGVLIEPKDDIKRRLGRSPDLADAVALAHLQTLALKISSNRSPREQRRRRLISAM